MFKTRASRNARVKMLPFFPKYGRKPLPFIALGIAALLAEEGKCVQIKFLAILRNPL